MTRVYGPKAPDHPSVGKPCPNCNAAFQAGDMTVLATIAPASPEDEAKMKAGRPYIAEAVEMHEACSDSIEPEIRRMNEATIDKVRKLASFIGVAAASTGEPIEIVLAALARSYCEHAIANGLGAEQVLAYVLTYLGRVKGLMDVGMTPSDLLAAIMQGGNAKK